MAEDEGDKQLPPPPPPPPPQRWAATTAGPATVIEEFEEDSEQEAQEQEEERQNEAAARARGRRPPSSSYRDRPEWRGVLPLAPLPTDAAGGGAIAAIADRPGEEGAELRLMRGLFRAAALGLGEGEGGGGGAAAAARAQPPERSARVRALCGDLVRRLNPADYTAWAVRWECVLALAREQQEATEAEAGAAPAAAAAAAAAATTLPEQRALGLLAEEDAFTRMVAREAGTKNYQLWNHRRKIAHAAFGLDPQLPVVVVRGGGGCESGASGHSGNIAPPQPPPPPKPALRLALARELAFADLALKGPDDDDAKNYHAWAHRQAALAACAGQMVAAAAAARRLPLAAAAAAQAAAAEEEEEDEVDALVWDPELRYCEERLREDVRNNSAWAQRMFVLLKGGGGRALGGGGGGGGGGLGGGAPSPRRVLPAAVVEREVSFVADALLRAPRNESAWSYLWGLLGGDGGGGGGGASSSSVVAAAANAATTPAPAPFWPRKVHELCCAVLDDDPNCAPALDALAGFYGALARAAAARAAAVASSGKAEASSSFAAARQAADSALRALESAEVADPVRRGYWQWRAGEVRAILEDAECGGDGTGEEAGGKR
jgi:hypothetical protein